MDELFSQSKVRGPFVPQRITRMNLEDDGKDGVAEVKHVDSV